MTERGPHELVAAYAVHALDGDVARDFERHLATCGECRDELARLLEAAAALGASVDGPEPPPDLRRRVVERVRAERGAAAPQPVVRGRRWLVPALAAATALFAAATVGLGTWLAVEAGRDSPAHDILAAPDARVVALEGATGRLVVAPGGEAALVVDGLEPLPSDRVYELWVIDGEPRPAGLFRPTSGGTVVELERPVPPGATVAITVEPAGGSEAPSGDPLVTAQA